MTTPNETCPHCTHAWAGHAPDYDNPQAGRCAECGCRWRNPADIPPPPPPMTAYDRLIASIENVIWNTLAAQDSPMGGPFVDREMGTVDSSGSEVDMTAVAHAVAAIFVYEDDCTSCHSPCAISEWAEPINGDDAE